MELSLNYNHETLESDDAFLWIFNQLEYPAFYISSTAITLALTPAAATLFNITEQDVKNQSISNLFFECGLEIIIESDNQVCVRIKDNEVFRKNSNNKKIVDLNWQVYDKTSRYGQCIGKIIYSKQLSNIEYLAQIHKEITGQDKSPTASVEYYAKSVVRYLENIIASMPGNVFWVDRKGRLLGCNDNQVKFFGFPKAQAIGMTYLDIEKAMKLPVGQSDSWRKDDEEVMVTGIPKINFEEPVIKFPDGREAYYLTNRVPILNEKGDAIGVLGITIDVTDKKHNESLRIAKETAEKTADHLKKLAESIVHGVRTPLATIMINLMALQKHISSLLAKLLYNPQANELFETQKCANNIKAALITANSDINTLMLKLRVSADGKIYHEYRKTPSITADIKAALDEYPFANTDNKLVTFNTNGVDFIYRGDPIFTKHILFNLLQNSLRAIKEARAGNIIIALEVPNNSSYNYLIFADTAASIDPELIPSLFKPFGLESSDSPGLGLTFCKIVMNSYGGDISCSSKAGEYTQFVLSFPKLQR